MHKYFGEPWWKAKRHNCQNTNNLLLSSENALQVKTFMVHKIIDGFTLLTLFKQYVWLSFDQNPVILYIYRLIPTTNLYMNF